jgi:hypothetical protein
MPITKETIETILADISAAKVAAPPKNPPHVLGHNESAEDANIETTIENRGGRVLSVITIGGIGTRAGEVRRVNYLSQDGQERWAYAVPHRFDVDAFGEESLICSTPAYDRPDALYEAIQAAREARKSESMSLRDRLDAIDAKWSSELPAELGFSPRALPWLLKDARRIAYARQVRDQGVEVILTWPDDTLFEIQAKQDIRAALAIGASILETEPSRRMTAAIQLYSAAGILS